MIQRTSTHGSSGASAARFAIAVISAVAFFNAHQHANAQEIAESYVLHADEKETVFHVLADQIGIVPDGKQDFEALVKQVAGVGFDVVTANEDEQIIIVRTSGPARTYSALQEQAEKLMTASGPAIIWAGPVVKTGAIDRGETADTRNILIPTNVLIVKVREDIEDVDVMTIADRNGLRLLERNPVDKREYYFESRKDQTSQNVFTAARAFQEEGISEYATPNFYILIELRQFVPNDRLFEDQWPLKNPGQPGGVEDADIDADLAWGFGLGDPGTTIAVIDGGFDMDHADLTPNIPSGNGWDFSNCGPSDMFGCGDSDPSGGDTKGTRHGTMTAGAAAAAGNNTLGVSGSCPNCSLLPLKIGSPRSPVLHHAFAFRHAQARGAEIITASWGYRLLGMGTLPVVNAIRNANASGSVIFFAMTTTGEGGYEHDCVPINPTEDDVDISALDEVIAVSASNNADTRTPAGYGNCMDVVAPTDDELANAGSLWPVSTDITGPAGYNSNHSVPVAVCHSAEPVPPPADARSYTVCANGTSYAAPLTAGVAGLMQSLDNQLTPLRHRQILQDTADKIEPAVANYDRETGFSSPTVAPTPQRPGSAGRPASPGGVGSTHGFGRVNAFEAVRLVAPTAAGGRGEIDVFLRDNRLDWGNTEQPSNVLMDNPRGFIAHYKSVSIKIDAPPFDPTPPTTPEGFADFPDEEPRAEVTNRVFVLVRNRGRRAASNVAVKLLWVFAGTALPALPGDFWTAFPGDSADPTPWTVIGTRTIQSLGYSGASIAKKAGDDAQIVSFDFDAPALNPNAAAFRHYCLFAVINSADDPVSNESRTSLIPDQITPHDNNVTHRNVSLQNPPNNGSFTGGLFIRNPFKETILTRLRIVQPDSWKVSLSKFEPDRPFELQGNSEVPIEVKVALPRMAGEGDVEIRQEALREEHYEPIGGFVYRFTRK